MKQMRDWTYSEGCGCRVTFFVSSDYRTSRMLPGSACTAHTGVHQVAERDCLVDRAKQSLADYRAGRLAPKGPLDPALAKDDTCPRCLGELDTGWECNDCGFDAMPLIPPATTDTAP